MSTLSIVIPVYNAEAFLDCKLQKLCQQPISDLEIIVVDDGSTDNSLQICQHRLSAHPNATIVSQHNQGLSCARNCGIAKAQGDYILFLDCDDELVLESLKGILLTLNQIKPDVLMGKYYLHSSAGMRSPLYYTFPTAAESPVDYIYDHVPDSIWNAWRYVCKRDFLIQHNLYFIPNILCEDVDWTPRILEKATSVEFFDTPFYIYFYRPDSIMNTVSYKKTLDLNNTISRSFKLYQGKSYQANLYRRLTRESLYSLSDYCLFTAEQRRLLYGVIRSMAYYFRQYGTIPAKIFGYTCPPFPLYIWSLSLCVAKKARRIAQYLHTRLPRVLHLNT